MKKITCLLLASVLIISFLFVVPVQTEAATKAEYEYTRIDNSKTFTGGTFENYFQYPRLIGDSEAIKKINRTLESEGQAHINMNGYTIEEIEEFIERDYSNYNTKCEYFNTVDGKAAFNKQNVFSIRYSSAWFAGGVSNYDLYGDTFDLKTGKKLNITQVVDRDYSGYTELSSKIYKKLKKKYDQEVADTFLNNYKTSKKMKKADFYVTSKGKVIVCFRTYDLSYGAAGCLTVTLPSRY